MYIYFVVNWSTYFINLSCNIDNASILSVNLLKLDGYTDVVISRCRYGLRRNTEAMEEKRLGGSEGFVG